MGEFGHPARLLGFGYFQAWMYFAVLSPSLLSSGAEAASVQPQSGVALSVFLVISVLACVVVSTRVRFYDQPALLVASSLVATVGTVLMAAVPGGDVAVRLAGVAMVDAGTAVLIMYWGRLWSRINVDRMAAHLVVSCLFAGVFYCVLALLPRQVVLAATALLPLASAMTLLRCDSEPLRDVTSEDESVTPSLWKAGAALVSIPIAYSLVRTFFVTGDATLLGGAHGLVMLTFSVAALAMAVVVLAHGRPYIGLVYRFAMTLMLFGLVSFIALPADLLWVASAAIMMGYSLFSELIWLIRPSIELQIGHFRAQVFGWGRLLLHLCALIGVLMGNQFLRQPWADGFSPAIATMAMTMLIVILAINVLSERDFMLYVRPLKVEGAASYGDDQAEADPERVFEERCAWLAAEYGLSTRELDVLKLLARGRSLPYIEEALHISNSTARTHTRSIYRKLDIHSRQSLINLVEG